MADNANPAGANGGAQPESIRAAAPMVAQQARPNQRFALDLRMLFDPELSDLEARYRWLAQQRDVEYERETRELIQLWLDDIAAELRRRQWLNLTSPAPSYGFPLTRKSNSSATPISSG
jgi:hypothetical protein